MATDSQIVSVIVVFAGLCCLLSGLVGYLLERILGALVFIIVTLLCLGALLTAGYTDKFILVWLLLAVMAVANFRGALFPERLLGPPPSGIGLVLALAWHVSCAALLALYGLFGWALLPTGPIPFTGGDLIETAIRLCHLILVIIVIGEIGALLPGHLLSRQRRSLPIMVLWYGFCALLLFGYLVAGWIGLLTITFPLMLLFWLVIVALSGWFILPLQNAGEWRLAIKSLLTFTLGTNYPYYVVENGEAIERVPGNPYSTMLAGPGIILTPCDHAVAVWDGFQFKRVPDPGLSFTHQYETIQEVVDLRPQLRSFPVEARTKDGIAIRVTTFVPFQIDRGRRQPKLGAGFPFSKKAVFQAVHAPPIERRQEWRGVDEAETRERRRWDELVPIMASRIMKDLIAARTFDELCEPFDLARGRDPRQRMRNQFLKRLRAAVAPWGIQVIGGGFSNLLPVDEGALKTRVENWRARWAPNLIVTLGKGEEAALTREEEVRTLARLDLLDRVVGPLLSQLTGLSTEERRAYANVIGMRFIDEVEQMMGNQLVKRSLAPEVVKTLEYLRTAVSNEEQSAQQAEE